MIDDLPPQGDADWWVAAILGLREALRRPGALLEKERHTLVPIAQDDLAVLLFLGIEAFEKKFQRLGGAEVIGSPEPLAGLTEGGASISTSLVR